MLKIRQFLWLISYSFYPASKLFSFFFFYYIEFRTESKTFLKTKEHVEGNLLVFAQTFLKIVIMEFGFFHIVN